MPLTAGERLGRYEISSIVGRGGMGIVYKATDTLLGRSVAIKTLSAEHGYRFEREARAIAALSHPHICQLYDVGTDYLIMEFVEGVALQRSVCSEQTRDVSDYIRTSSYLRSRGNVENASRFPTFPPHGDDD